MSVAFRRDRRLRGEPGERLLERALASLLSTEPPRRRRRRPADLDSLKAALSALLANLVAARRNRINPAVFVGVSFDDANYVGGAFTTTSLRSVRDFLTRQGLAEGQRGYQRVISGGGFAYQAHARTTRLRATAELTAWFDAAGIDSLAGVGDPASGLGWSASTPLIVRKEPIDNIPEPQDVQASRPVLRENNRRAAAADLALPLAVWRRLQHGAAKAAEPSGDEMLDRLEGGDTSAVALRRVFRRTWDEGGRLYGGWWQTVPKWARSHITINGNATVELDYGRLHPTLLYAQRGLSLDFDPYLPEGTDEALRDVGKRLFNRLVNAVDLDPHRCSLRPKPEDRPLLPDGFDFSSFARRLIAMHSGIEDAFGTGAGVRLQRIDSDIMVEVLDRLHRAGAFGLPIHDSVIVPATDIDTARYAMESAYRDLTGHEAGPISVMAGGWHEGGGRR